MVLKVAGPVKIRCGSKVVLHHMTYLNELDVWDPNNWTVLLPERRIYGDDNAQYYAVVDEEDYWHFTRHKWVTKRSRCYLDKVYLRRALGINEGGQRLKTITLYLHVEIMKRTGILSPTKAHCLVDHRDGDSLNCRRSNLRWATHSMNVLNKFGSNGHDLIEG